MEGSDDVTGCSQESETLAVSQFGVCRAPTVCVCVRARVPQAAVPPAEELLQCHRLWVGLPRLGVPGRPAGIPAVPEPEAAADGSDGLLLPTPTYRFVRGRRPSCPLIGRPVVSCLSLTLTKW